MPSGLADILKFLAWLDVECRGAIARHLQGVDDRQALDELRIIGE